MDHKRLEQLKEMMEKIAPLPWSFGSNYPFEVDVRKPRHSLSKHTESRPTSWDYHDGAYLAECVNIMPELLAYVELLETELEKEHAFVDSLYKEAEEEQACDDCSCGKKGCE